MDGGSQGLHFQADGAWPGLARLWHAGRPSGLFLAVVFSILLNSALISTLVWPGLWTRNATGALWTVTLAIWVAGWADAHRFHRQRALAEQDDPQLDLFLSARGEYLHGDWNSAERTLEQLLRATPDDVEARLMLATLLRHQRRWEEAREQLRRLQRWRRAAAWNLEIRTEWERLSKLECSTELAVANVDSSPQLTNQSAGPRKAA